MDLKDPNRFRHRKPTLSPTERFLGLPSHPPRVQNPSSTTAATATTEDEDLIEDDVVFSNNNHENDDEDSTEPSSSTSPIPNHYHSHHHKALAFGGPDASFGILAALPENDHPSPNGSYFFHQKPSVSVSLSSSSSSSSARLIPVIPKPPPDRLPSSSVKFHQSAPVNIPLFPTRRRCEFEEEDDAVEEEEMLPPHEIVARNSALSPALACSVLEGVGRTLKGRDLRQVRNAVWRQTGFLD